MARKPGYLLVVPAMIAAGCGGAATRTVTVTTPPIDAGPSASQPTETTTRADGATVATVSETTRDGGLQFRVTRFYETARTLPVKEFSDPVKATKGAKFVVAEVTVKNLGKKSTMPFCGGTGTVLIDSENRNFDAASEKMIDLAGNERMCDQINPGFRTSMQLLFEVPSDTQPKAVALWDTDEVDDYFGTTSWVRVSR